MKKSSRFKFAFPVESSPIKKWFLFFKFLGQEGNLRQNPFDFDEFKIKALNGLHEFNRFGKKKDRQPKKFILGKFKKYPICWNIIQNIALFKNSLLKPDFQVITIKKLKLIYFRVPKAGSTSQLAALLRKIYPEIDVETLSVNQINVLGEGLLASKLPEGQESFFKYGIVRNPFSRLVSFYLTYFNGKEEEFIFQNYLFGILKPNDAFPDLVDKIARIPDILKDPHFKPQYKLLGMEYYKDINWVKLEKLKQDFKEIREHFQLEIPLMNKSSGYHLSDFYDKDIFDKVYQIYQKDIELFDYHREYHALKKQTMA